MSVFGHFRAEIKDKELDNGWFLGQLIHDGWIWLIPLPEGDYRLVPLSMFRPIGKGHRPGRISDTDGNQHFRAQEGGARLN